MAIAWFEGVVSIVWGINERRRHEALAGYCQIEDVEAIIISNHVMKLLGLDTAAQIEFGVRDTFFVL